MSNYNRRSLVRPGPSSAMSPVAEGEEDLANMDPAHLQMILDDIETGWAFEHSSRRSLSDNNLLDRSDPYIGMDESLRSSIGGGPPPNVCVCEFAGDSGNDDASTLRSADTRGNPCDHNKKCHHHQPMPQVQFVRNHSREIHEDEPVSRPQAKPQHQGSSTSLRPALRGGQQSSSGGYCTSNEGASETQSHNGCGSQGGFSAGGYSFKSRSKNSIAVSTAYYSSAGMTNVSNMSGLLTMIPRRVSIMACSIFLLGLISMSVIFGLGLSAEARNQNRDFSEIRDAIVDQLDVTLQEYLQMGLLLHQATAQPTMTHQGFSVFWDYVQATSPPSPACGIAFYVDGIKDKEAMENTTEAYLAQEFPDYEGYRGIEGLPEDPHRAMRTFNIIPHELFYPLHFWEPLQDPVVRRLVDFDIYSVPPLKTAVTKAVQFQQPALSPLLDFLPNHNDTTFAQQQQQTNSVMLLHPGLNALQTESRSRRKYRRRATAATTKPMSPSLDLSVVTIQITDILEALNTLELEKNVDVYLYDSTNHDESEDPNEDMTFLGAARIKKFDEETNTQKPPEVLPPPNDLKKLEEDFEPFYNVTTINIATRQWTFIVAVDEDELPFQPEFIFLAGYCIFFACCAIAAGLLSNQYRMAKMNIERQNAEKDRMILKIKNARKQAHQERALNDFLAHEVRNPLSAAISATSFVYAAIHEDVDNHDSAASGSMLKNAEKRKSVLDDVIIIDASLHFANDLLRNMLDMHRAASGQLNVEFTPVDILHDVLEPVANMLYTRDADYELQIDCNPPEGLIVMSDRLRLKQMVLNLARNATKFVQTGFLRLKADVDAHGMVYVAIEDSGPGIPEDKKMALFQKFQESLDLLNQGTGIGLSLCKKIMTLLGGEIWLDDKYDSGVEGNPGARFVISLDKRPLDEDVVAEHTKTHLLQEGARTSIRKASPNLMDHTLTTSIENQTTRIDWNKDFKLPDTLSVLFVDDDAMLRKLFSRSLKRAMPGWQIREASNGETALRLVETDDFDLIFMDQYMSSTEKQLTGTETVRNLRAKGVKEPIVCGLSANDIELNFLKNGADAFLIKPLPCNKDELQRALVTLLKKRGEKYRGVDEDQEASPDDGSVELVPKTNSIPMSDESKEDSDLPNAALRSRASSDFNIAPPKTSHFEPNLFVSTDALPPKTTPLFNIAPPQQSTGEPAPLESAPLFNISAQTNTDERTNGDAAQPTPLFSTSDSPAHTSTLKRTPLFYTTPQHQEQTGQQEFAVNPPNNQRGPAPLFSIAPEASAPKPASNASSSRPAPLFDTAPPKQCNLSPSKQQASAGQSTAPEKKASLFDINPQETAPAPSKVPAPLFSIVPPASKAPSNVSAPKAAPLFDIAPPKQLQSSSILQDTAKVPSANVKSALLLDIKRKRGKTPAPFSTASLLPASVAGTTTTDEKPPLLNTSGQEPPRSQQPKPTPLFSINPQQTPSATRNGEKPPKNAPLFQINPTTKTSPPPPPPPPGDSIPPTPAPLFDISPSAGSTPNGTKADPVFDTTPSTSCSSDDFTPKPAPLFNISAPQDRNVADGNPFSISRWLEEEKKA